MSWLIKLDSSVCLCVCMWKTSHHSHSYSSVCVCVCVNEANRCCNMIGKQRVFLCAIVLLVTSATFATARDIPTSAQRWKKRPSFMHHSCTVRHHLVAFHTNCWTNESNERPAAAEEEEVPKSIEKRHDRSVCPRRPRHVEPLLRAITDRNVAHTHIHIHIYTHIHTPTLCQTLLMRTLWHTLRSDTCLASYPTMMVQTDGTVHKIRFAESSPRTGETKEKGGAPVVQAGRIE